MDLSKINKVGRLDNLLPNRKMSELKVGKTYTVNDLRVVQTKYGIRIIADLNGKFCVFLPARIGKVLTEDAPYLEELISAARQTRLRMEYHGGQYNQIEFQYLTENTKFDDE